MGERGWAVVASGGVRVRGREGRRKKGSRRGKTTSNIIEHSKSLSPIPPSLPPAFPPSLLQAPPPPPPPPKPKSNKTDENATASNSTTEGEGEGGKEDGIETVNIKLGEEGGRKGGRKGGGRREGRGEDDGGR